MLEAANLILNVIGVGALCTVVWQLGCIRGAIGGLRDRVNNLETWRNGMWPRTGT